MVLGKNLCFNKDSVWLGGKWFSRKIIFHGKYFSRKIDFHVIFFIVWFKIDYFCRKKKACELNNFNGEKYPLNDHIRDRYRSNESEKY